MRLWPRPLARLALVLAVLGVLGVVLDAHSQTRAADRAELVALAKRLPDGEAFAYERAVDEVLQVTIDDTEASFLLTWGRFESGWGRWVLGDCTCWEPLVTLGSWGGERVGLGWVKTDCPDLSKRTVDNCKSFGPGQTQDPAHWYPGATPKAVIHDRVLGYRVMLAIWRHCYRACDGDVRKAAGKYSSGGGCYESEKVRKRCAYGGC